MADTTTTMTLKDWRAELERRGKLDCKFVCPSCGNKASPNDFKAAGADFKRATTECIGRVDSKLGGCDWAAFGLLDICTVHVDMGDGKATPAFEFAEDGDDA